MLFLTKSVAITLTILIFNIQNQNDATTMSTHDDVAEREVLATVDAFNRAFAANDPETYFTFIDDGITVFTPSNPYTVDGLIADREEFEFSLRKGLSKVGYFQQLQTKVRLHGDMAIVTYYSRGSYGPSETTAYYKETDVLVRKNGKWKIIHIHVSKTS